MHRRFKNSLNAKGTLAFITLIDPVQGRTTMTRGARRADYAKTLPQFRAIRSAIDLPD